jgi:hypothetical protein
MGRREIDKVSFFPDQLPVARGRHTLFADRYSRFAMLNAGKKSARRLATAH